MKVESSDPRLSAFINSVDRRFQIWFVSPGRGCKKSFCARWLASRPSTGRVGVLPRRKHRPDQTVSLPLSAVPDYCDRQKESVPSRQDPKVLCHGRGRNLPVRLPRSPCSGWLWALGNRWPPQKVEERRMNQWRTAIAWISKWPPRSSDATPINSRAGNSLVVK